MVKTDHTARRADCRVVYCGPSESGKTTNLQHLYQRLDPETRGKLISPTSGDDRSFFFDFLAVEIGAFRGFRVRLHLYTLPGGGTHDEGRGRILRGADGIVFVADSDPERASANEDSLLRLYENLDRLDHPVDDLAFALQYNKRDLPDAVPLETLQESLNPDGADFFEAIAVRGEGVFETITGVGAEIVRAFDPAAGSGGTAGAAASGGDGAEAENGGDAGKGEGGEDA